MIEWMNSEWLTSDVHEITGGEYRYYVSNVAPVGQHADRTVLPSEYLFGRLCDGPPCVPYQSLAETQKAVDG